MSDGGTAGRWPVSAQRISWRGAINQILFELRTQQILDDPIPSKMARAMVGRRYFGAGPDAYAHAISTVLSQEGSTAGDIPTPHTEQAVRDFLARVSEELSALKPWPNYSELSSARPMSPGQRIAEEAKRKGWGRA